MPKKRILIVDDEADIREVASMSLELTAGWETVQAASGFEGIAKAVECQPDAILMDVMMPVMDGPATLGRLRASDATKDIPVILLTAKVQVSDRRRFSGLGVAGVLAKPFDPMTLAQEISRLLSW